MAGPTGTIRTPGWPSLKRRAPYLLLLVLVLAACGGPSIQGVVSVEILGGDRSLPQGATAVLAAEVSAGSGVATTVTWLSSDPSIATVDANGVVTGQLLGSVTVTARSTADVTVSDSVTIEVAVPAGTVRANWVPSDAFPLPVLGAGLVMAAADAIAPTSMTEIEPGIFAGPVSPLDENGGVNIHFPPLADIPAELFQPATALVSGVDTFPDCALTADQPGVLVTTVVSETLPFLTIPAVFLVTGNGLFPVAVNDVVFDLGAITQEELYASPFVVWVYAQGDVSVHSTGAGCSVAPGVDFAVDVDLMAGWNQLAWVFDWDAVSLDVSGVGLVNSAVAELYLNPVFLP